MGPVEEVDKAEEEGDSQDERHQQHHLRVLRLGFRGQGKGLRMKG